MRAVPGLDAAMEASKEGPAIVYVRSDACSVSASLDAVVGERICANGLKDKTIVADVTGVGGSSTPRLLWVDGGRVIDEHLGSQHPLNHNAAIVNGDYVDHFLMRNGLVAGELGPIEARRGGLPTRLRERRSMSGGGVSLMMLDGEDLAGWKIKNAIVAGCSLRGTDLRNADLSYSLFSHTDLTGAKLEGARMEDVRWNQVTCPDGRFSPRGPCEPVGEP